jgi:hypothetical protein
MKRALEPIIQRMMCAAIFTLSLSFLASGQQQDRVVDWQPVIIKSEAKVLQIVDIKVAGESITIGHFFTANDAWLNTVTFRVRNISGKIIKYLGFGVAFPEIDANGRTPMFSITYGTESIKGVASTRKLLMPDEEVDLKLPEDQLEIMRQISMKLTGTSNLSKVNILPGLVGFEDGSGIGGSNAAAQSVNPCDHPNNLPSSFFEVPQGPQGTWTASQLPDLRQADDPLVPVVVGMAGAIQGPANRRGMRLGCGVLRNRSQKSVTAVQLRWILVRNQDRLMIAQKGYTADTVLLEGHTPPIELSIPKESLRRADFSIISFAAVTKDLAKEGILTGDYFLFVGVYEVLFEDGSVWNAGPVVR